MSQTPEDYPKSDKDSEKLCFNKAGDDFFTPAGTCTRPVHGQEVLAMGSQLIEDLAKGVPRTLTVRQRIPLWDTDHRPQSSTA